MLLQWNSVWCVKVAVEIWPTLQHQAGNWFLFARHWKQIKGLRYAFLYPLWWVSASIINEVHACAKQILAFSHYTFCERSEIVEQQITPPVFRGLSMMHVERNCLNGGQLLRIDGEREGEGNFRFKWTWHFCLSQITKIYDHLGHKFHSLINYL